VIEADEFEEIVEKHKLLEFLAIIVDDGIKAKAKREQDERANQEVWKIGLSSKKKERERKKAETGKRPSLLDVSGVLNGNLGKGRQSQAERRDDD
jgi:hypothetical protein